LWIRPLTAILWNRRGKVHTGPYIEFDGQDYEIAPTSRKVVTMLFHPFRKLWVLEHSAKLTWPPILGHFTLE